LQSPAGLRVPSSAPDTPTLRRNDRANPLAVRVQAPLALDRKNRHLGTRWRPAATSPARRSKRSSRSRHGSCGRSGGRSALSRRQSGSRRRRCAGGRERRQRASVCTPDGSPPSAPRSPAHALWLDERDLARPPTRAELHSQLDDIAARTAATDGRLEEIVEATDLRTHENVFCSIDPAILVCAFENDAAAAAGAEPSRDRLRRLLPDPALIHRRAAGETLRALARDYQVAHTTLARYFHRPEVAPQLLNAHRLVRASRKHRRTT
jgi:hypothetical protein